MNLYGPKQLAESMRTVRKNTIQIAEDIPEEDYNYRPTPESRSVLEILVHIASLSRFDRFVHEEQHLSSLEDFDFGAVFKKGEAEEKPVRTKGNVVALLLTQGDLWCQGGGATRVVVDRTCSATGRGFENPFRDARRDQRPRNAPSRTVDVDGADVGDCAAPHSKSAGAAEHVRGESTLEQQASSESEKVKPMGKLEGQIGPVTGGNSGIGLATAKLFVEEGARTSS